MIGRDGAPQPIDREDVKRVVTAIFDHAAREAAKRQFGADFEVVPPERPAWMDPGYFRKLCDETRAHVATMVWRMVPDDYRLDAHDLFLFRCKEGSFALSDANRVLMC